MTSYLGSRVYKSLKLTKIMLNSLKLLDYYILSNAPQKTRQWALNVSFSFVCPVVVSLAAVFSLVTQRSSPGGEERCVTRLKTAARETSPVVDHEFCHSIAKVAVDQ